jgi:hypothetical protein
MKECPERLGLVAGAAVAGFVILFQELAIQLEILAST